MPDKFTILRELKYLLQEHFQGDIKDVILFGSQATGTAREDSDYDVLIVVNGEYDWKYKKKIRYTCYDIDLKYNILTDTHIISVKEIQHSLKRYEPMYINALNKGIYI
jgi:predicted nucleotidyltransferase